MINCKDGATFDYVIIGGGSAGCVLANRLSEDGQHSVLLLEAGGDDRNIWIHIPVGYVKTMANSDLNWLFKTEPEPNLHNRQIPIPRGKVLGGSSSINGMVYVRGNNRDYDDWAQLGNRGWAYDDILPYFKKAENRETGENSWRGIGGPLNIANVRSTYPILDRVIDAAEEAGYERNSDYNGERQEGFGYFQVTQKNGRRWSAKTAYLDPARIRKNLVIQSHAMATKLIVEDGTTHGVIYRVDGLQRKVFAGREVLVSAGSVQSPQLLELSGIGRPEVLQRCGIKVCHRLIGVGENLQDHYTSRLVWKLKNSGSLNEKGRGLRLLGEVAKFAFGNSGALTMPAGIVAGFIRSRAELEVPDIQYHWANASFDDPAKRILHKFPGITAAPCQLRPESRGSIHIKSGDPYEAPSIIQNFLTEELDQQTLLYGIQIARKIMNTSTMQAFNDGELTPGNECQTDNEIIDFAAKTGATLYHPVGTCKMGNDLNAVVDERLRVHGIRRLRIVDGSVMPRLVSGNTNAPIIMIAEKAADMVREDRDGSV